MNRCVTRIPHAAYGVDKSPAPKESCFIRERSQKERLVTQRVPHTLHTNKMHGMMSMHAITTVIDQRLVYRSVTKRRSTRQSEGACRKMRRM